jgi:hypothetical protein
MGRVQLPDAPHVGNNHVVLDLDADELGVTVGLLKQVLAAARGAPPTQRVSPPPVERPAPAPSSTFSSPSARADPSGAEPVPPLPLVRTWNSPPAEHQNLPVTALSWHQTAGSLDSSGDAHAGWLFSASRGCINLWECQPGGGVGGEPVSCACMCLQSITRSAC